MKNRLLSLDVLRGLTIMLMTVVNNPGDWGHVYAPLLHAEWHGYTPTDLVFPTFLLIVGVSVVLAMPHKRWNSDTLLKIAIRTLRIFCLGWFLFFFSKIQLPGLEGPTLLLGRLAIMAILAWALFSEYEKKYQFYVAVGTFLLMILLAFGGFDAYETVRIPGVLQRIAMVYGLIAVLYLRTSWQVQAVVGVTVLLLYWGLMTLIPVPGVGQANLEKGTNLAAWLDYTLLPGHLWASAKTWDPEGILSTLPALGTGIAGLLTGTLLRTPSLTGPQKARYLLLAGLGGIVLGSVWHIVFPINKALWTSSYVLVAAGWALVVLSGLYYWIDVKGSKGWTLPFVVFGVNPMLVFFFSGIIPRILSAIPVHTNGKSVSLQHYLYSDLLAPQFSNPMNASLAWALLYLAFWGLIVWVLYRKGVVVKV
ncbi:acyltransferase family protein [Siphonobacter curvatus]|uniref:DUF5009 domain-containing protein n=1 Tax=Siphonobacter curvatus TaxID=2094562 RepID=A0A2S7IMV2_9BACT|nr:DUF5009 domain-containing protein [Siphonobacter curvatus]PQA58979.1 DUF5009 domain-containing protein [Siphonobacter curvatus]